MEFLNTHEKDTKEVLMACMDFLIWVGQTYKNVEDYILEASKQGCCRRIQGFPLEVVPGLSRVFLVHKDSREECTQGSLFGFYYVDRVEIITSSKVLESIESLKNKWAEDFFNKFFNSFGKHRDDFNEGDEEKRDNIAKKIRKRVRKSWGRSYPRRVAKGEIRDSKPTGGDPYDDIMREIFSEILEELFNYLLDKLKTHDIQLLSREEHTELQGGAGCSKRKTIGAVYLVDSLFREIGDKFQSELQTHLEGLSEEDRINFLKNQKDTEASRKEIYPEEGIELWRICQKETLMNRKSRTEILKELRDKAEIAKRKLYWDEISKRLKREKFGNEEEVKFEGELVVFRKPYPIYEHLPKAAFRGYRRIDGAYLLRQIFENIEKPLIPYCPSCLKVENDFKFSDPPSEREIIDAVKRELLVDENCTVNFIKNLTSIQMEALQECNISFLTALERYKNV